MNHNKHKNKSLIYYKDQYYECIGCGKCCNVWDVYITPQENEKLKSLILPGLKNVDSFSEKLRGSSLYKLKKNEKSCIFLDENNRCIIHARYGESAKPIACRLYPFDICLWKDDINSVSLRYDCPAATSARGNKISEHSQAIGKLTRELSKTAARAKCDYSRRTPAPLHTLRLLCGEYRNLLDGNSANPAPAFYAAARIMDFHSKQGFSEEDAVVSVSDFETIGSGLEAFEELISSAPPPELFTRIVFRYVLASYARIDDTSKRFSISGRIKNTLSMLKIILGKAPLHKLNPDCPAVETNNILEMMGKTVFTKECMDVYFRFLNSKLCSMQFCGSNYVKMTFEEGIRHLLLTLPVSCAFASVFAAGRKTDKASAGDMQNAIMLTAYNFARSPFFSLSHVKSLQKALCGKKYFPQILSALSISH